MKKRCFLAFCLLLCCLFSLGCSGYVRVGYVETVSSYNISANYRLFRGQQSYHLDAPDFDPAKETYAIDVWIETEEGTLDVTILYGSQEVWHSDSTSGGQYVLPMGGRYTIRMQGDDHRGSVRFLLSQV